MLRFFGGGTTSSGGSASGITQAQLDTALLTLQDKATAATDSELAAAVSTLTTAVGTKQNSSTAATDAELASAVALLQDKATAATDSELSAAIAIVNASIALKQDSSTAATDAELSSAIATVNSSLSGKQDAATAATDAELAAAIATINSATALKQDASTAATDTELAAGLLTVPKSWVPLTAYVANQWVIAPGGYLAQAKTGFTSGASYVSSNWNEYNYGKELGYAERTTGDTTTNTGTTDGSLNSNLMNGLSILGIVGAGNTVNVELFLPYNGHSVISKQVAAYIMVNGAQVASAQCVSPSTSAGMAIIAKRRLVLTAGTTYDFTVGKSAATGTGSYVMAPAYPGYISVTQA